MKGARLTIPTPALLQKAVDGLDEIPMQDHDVFMDKVITEKATYEGRGRG